MPSALPHSGDSGGHLSHWANDVAAMFARADAEPQEQGWSMPGMSIADLAPTGGFLDVSDTRTLGEDEDVGREKETDADGIGLQRVVVAEDSDEE